MRTAIVLLLSVVLALTGCAAATTPDVVPAPVVADAPAPSSPAVTQNDVPKVPAVTHTDDSPVSCASSRFSRNGLYATDSATGLTWIAYDAGFYLTSGTPGAATTPVGACATYGDASLRVATTAEVLALTSAVPGCRLPDAFAGVYEWANHDVLPFFADDQRPIVTSDGCVDLKTGKPFAGACQLSTPTTLASTMCVK